MCCFLKVLTILSIRAILFVHFFFLGKNPMDFPLNWIQGLWKLYSFNCTNAFHSSNFVNDFFSHTISSSSIRAWRFSGFPKTLMNWMRILQNSLKFVLFFTKQRVINQFVWYWPISKSPHDTIAKKIARFIPSYRKSVSWFNKTFGFKTTTIVTLDDFFK